MLPITKKMQRLDSETNEVLKDIKSIESLLRKIEKGKASIRELEEYWFYGFFKEGYVLKEDTEAITSVIRAVCSEEKTVSDALKEMEEAFKEILIVRSGIIKMQEEMKNCE